MTNEEFYTKKIDEEYQKYFKGLNIPSKEEWLKMEHEEEIKHKFNAGDIIQKKCNTEDKIIILKIDKNMYYMKDYYGTYWTGSCEYIDNMYDFFV